MSSLKHWVDLKKELDSVHSESSWEILRLRGIPVIKIIKIIASPLYNDTAIMYVQGTSIFFPVNSGVKQTVF